MSKRYSRQITVISFVVLLAACTSISDRHPKPRFPVAATTQDEREGFNGLHQALIADGFIVLAKDAHKTEGRPLIELNASYHDSNGNSKVDKGDAGFFNPASTVKVALAGLVLEKLAGSGISLDAQYRTLGSSRWNSIQDDLKTMLVISDNDATNRLIHFLGFFTIQTRLGELGLAQTSINRLMLNKGTLVASPRHEIMSGNTLVTTPPSPALDSSRITCLETSDHKGNCSTAVDLIKSLQYLLDSSNNPPGFRIRPADRNWVNHVMSRTPRQNGYDYPDEYCRFIAPVAKTKSLQVSSVQSKCGVALFSHTYVDLSRISFKSGRAIDLLIAKTYDGGVDDSTVVGDFTRAATSLIQALPKSVR